MTLGDAADDGLFSTTVTRPDDGSVPVAADGPTHSQVWFGPPERPLYGWLSVPRGRRARGGVVLCPPMGEEGRAAHRTFRRLAESLAEVGLVALRFDYDGTGDSAGAQDDPDRVGSWLASVEAARELLVELGAGEVSAVGMRLGGTLAACQAAASTGFDSLVLWDPCASGRTFLREGQALYLFGEAAGDAGEPDDGWRRTPGFQYDEATARGLRTIDLAKLPVDVSLARRILLLGREDRPLAGGVEARVEQDVAESTVGVALDQELLLDLDPSANFVPERAMDRVVEWLVAGAGDWRPVQEPPEEGSVVLASGGVGSALVRERSVRLGASQLYGIADEPLQEDPRLAGADRRPWVVLVNVSAEHHIGPGRRWVEFARHWAALGYRCIRVDQSGIGDSPTRAGELEDEPFAPEWIDDMREVVTSLTADGSTVAMVGLCSAAYSAFEAALWSEPGAVVGILAVNLRLTIYPAVKGSPVWTDQRRAAVVPFGFIGRLVKPHRRTGEGLWRAYRQLAVWHAAYPVLSKVVSRGTTLRMISCTADARDLTEVAFWRPALRRLRRDPRFSLEAYDSDDHSMLGRALQELTFERATTFVQEMHGDAVWDGPS